MHLEDNILATEPEKAPIAPNSRKSCINEMNMSPTESEDSREINNLILNIRNKRY